MTLRVILRRRTADLLLDEARRIATAADVHLIADSALRRRCLAEPKQAAGRTVVPHQAGWAVSDSDFVTTDKTLAEAVAREFDRQDGRSYPQIGTEKVWMP